jgi:hypothetical protein
VVAAAQPVGIQLEVLVIPPTHLHLKEVTVEMELVHPLVFIMAAVVVARLLLAATAHLHQMREAMAALEQHQAFPAPR